MRLLKLFLLLSIISAATFFLCCTVGAEITYIEEGWIKEPSTNESLISTYTNNHINNKNKEITISKKSGFDSYSLTKQYDITQIPIRYYKISYNETSRETTKTLDNKLTHYINLNLLSKTKFKLQNLQNPMDYEIQIGFGTETYTPSENTIYLDGETYTLNDIYEADLLNGWNKFFKHNSTFYSMECDLQIGNGSTTYLEMNHETLMINRTHTSSSEKSIDIQNNNGQMNISYSMIIVRDANSHYMIDNNNVLHIDNSSFYCIDSTSRCLIRSNLATETTIINNSAIIGEVSLANGFYILNNVISCGETYSGEAIYTGTFNNFFITNKEQGLRLPRWQTSFTREVSDLTLNNCLVDFWLDINNSGNIHNLTFTDLLTGRTNNEMYVDYNANPTEHVHRNFTFNLDTTPSAAVKLYDVNGNLIVDTTSDANGDISEYSLLMATYGWDIAGADGTAHRRYYPYRLVISKDDYITYNQTFNNSLLPVNYNIKLIADSGALGSMNIDLSFITLELIVGLIWLLLLLLICLHKDSDVVGFFTLFFFIMWLSIWLSYSIYNSWEFAMLSICITVVGFYRFIGRIDYGIR